jgi:hypothetical protein
MAKTKTREIIRYRAPAAAAPIIKYRTRKPAKVKRRGGKRHHGERGLQKAMISSGVGGYALGLLEKQFPNLPSLPILGKKGGAALIGYFVAKQGGTLGQIGRDVALVAMGIAGYEYGTTGKVTGDLAKQVSGVAAQV